MNTKLTIRTEAQITELKLSEITTINNEFAVANGTKETKRFGTKPAAIKKCLSNQAAYVEQRDQYLADNKDPVEDFIEKGGEVTQCPPQKNPKQKAPTSKSALLSTKGNRLGRSGGERKPANSFSMNIGGSRIVYDIPTTLVSVVKTTDKADSMVGTLIQAIEDSLEPTVEEIVNYVVTNYKRPKSAKEVDRSFVIRKIKRAVQKGYLKLESA
jgi:hypothetical protein